MFGARARLVALGCPALLAAGCVSDNRPDAATCAQPQITIELRLENDALEPNAIAVCREQLVTLDIDVRQDGVLDLHGYELAQEIEAGKPAQFAFPADRSGQFPIELHPAGGGEAIDVGILTVHEP